MKFLNYDSPFMEFLRNLVDYVTVGLLWIIFSVPVFTSGAALTAALLTAEISIHKQEGAILKTFMKWFRKEFKDATVLWAIRLPLTVMGIGSVVISFGIGTFTAIKILICITNCLLLGWTLLWFGYLSRFEDRIKTVLGNTLRMAIGSAGWILLIGILSVLHIVATVLLLFEMPPLLVLVPGSYLIFYRAVVTKIFCRYLPKDEQNTTNDTMTV